MWQIFLRWLGFLNSFNVVHVNVQFARGTLDAKIRGDLNHSGSRIWNVTKIIHSSVHGRWQKIQFHVLPFAITSIFSDIFVYVEMSVPTFVKSREDRITFVIAWGYIWQSWAGFMEPIKLMLYWPTTHSCCAAWACQCSKGGCCCQFVLWGWRDGVKKQKERIFKLDSNVQVRHEIYL